jgi:asparagine synthase (glutamine-hydrolysing)
MSMAVSLEVRVPFLDHELVEFILGLPAAKKDRPGLVKSLLIDSTSDLLPREIYDRRKRGFELPMSAWIKGPLREFSLAGLQHIADVGIGGREDILGYDREFLAGRLPWQKLWSLVVLGWYLHKVPSAVEHE